MSTIDCSDGYYLQLHRSVFLLHRWIQLAACVRPAALRDAKAAFSTQSPSSLLCRPVKHTVHVFHFRFLGGLIMMNYWDKYVPQISLPLSVSFCLKNADTIERDGDQYLPSTCAPWPSFLSSTPCRPPCRVQINSINEAVTKETLLPCFPCEKRLVITNQKRQIHPG